MKEASKPQHSIFDNPDLPLSELFAYWPEMALVFLDRRMLCPGCPIAPFHTITDACREYELNEDVFRETLWQKVIASDTVRDGRRSE